MNLFLSVEKAEYGTIRENRHMIFRKIKTKILMSFMAGCILLSGNNAHAEVITGSDAHPEEPTTSEEIVYQEEEITNPRDDYNTVSLDEEDGRIEQLQAIMPNVRAYFYMNDSSYSLDAENVVATLDGKTLKTSYVKNWAQTDMGINYFFLVDISTSMDSDSFEAVKEEIITFANKHMTDKDTITVYTVGDITECIVDSVTYEDKDIIEEFVSELQCDNNNTYLDDAILQVVKDIKKERETFGEEFPNNRDVVIAFTDGVNESLMGTSSSEAENALYDEGVALYGLLVPNDSYSQAESTQKFEEISRASGGDILYFESDDLAEQLDLLVDDLNSVYVAEFVSDSNTKDYNSHTFSMGFYVDDVEKYYEYKPYSVKLTRNIKDTVNPQITEIAKVNDNTIEIKFSEQVVGADNVSAYIISKEDTNIIVANVSYDALNYVATVSTTDVLYKGHYIVTIENVTDNSMEKNILDNNSMEVDFDGREYKEKINFLERFWWLILLAFVLIIVIILIIVLHVIKKNKGVVVIDDKAVLASKTDVKQHVIIEQEKGQPITLYLHSGEKMIKKIETKVNGSIIIGRSDLCDIYIDDAMMSRQHFAIEFDGESFYVQDLDTTNGTVLNGVKMKHKRRLEAGDKITAGSLDIVVRW